MRSLASFQKTSQLVIVFFSMVKFVTFSDIFEEILGNMWISISIVDIYTANDGIGDDDDDDNNDYDDGDDNDNDGDDYNDNDDDGEV